METDAVKEVSLQVKDPAVNYRNFRPSKLNTPEFSHLKLLLGWVGYFILYILTEKLIPSDSCTSIHCFLDDIIPFFEWFVIPYVLWYGLVAGSLLYFILYRIAAFRDLSVYLIITQIAAMAIYILFPSRQDLRPEYFPRENILTALIGVLYRIDTSTNVCPSLHVAYSIGIASVWWREKQMSGIFRFSIALFALLVCLSTVFIKQHSVLDGVAAIPICLAAEWFVFHRKTCRRH